VRRSGKAREKKERKGGKDFEKERRSD